MKWRFCRIDFHQVLASKLGGTTDSLGLIEVRPFCSRRGLLGQSATQIGGAWMENPNAVEAVFRWEWGLQHFLLAAKFWAAIPLLLERVLPEGTPLQLPVQLSHRMSCL